MPLAADRFPSHDVFDLAAHDIAHLGGNIGHEAGGLDAKGLQDEIDPVIGITAARGDGFGQTGAALELRVSDGTANGVRIGIPMTDD